MDLKTRLRSSFLAAGVILCAGCSSFTDPAVRLAKCVERHSRSLDRSSQDRFSAPCRLGTENGYVVVLHPQGQLSDEELIQGGVPKGLLPFFREFRKGDNEQVFVFPSESVRYASRTTYQHRFARIPQLLVLEKKKAEPVVIELLKSEDAREITGVQ